MIKKKVPAKFKGDWTDINDKDLTWDDLIEEVKLMRQTVTNFYELLHKHKIPIRECDNASFQAKKTVYGWKDAEKKKVTPVVEVKKTKKRKK
jgi:hypothetical protein